MTPTEAAIVLDRFVKSRFERKEARAAVVTLLARHDRYEKALREIREYIDAYGEDAAAFKIDDIAQEALRCE